MYQAAGLAEAEVMESDRARIGGLRWLPSLTSVAFVVPLLLLYWQAGGPSTLLADPDTVLHIRTGDWIVAHRHVPRQDWYSFTIAGKPWCDWEWLSDVLFSILHRCGGLGAITAFSFLILCLTSVIVYCTARLHARRTVALAVTYIVMATTTIHWLARPHLLTWMLVALFCRLLDDSEFDELSRRWLLLPLLMALWTNLHGGFTAGLMVVASYVTGSAARAVLARCEEDKAPYRQRVRGHTALIVACLAATLINPYFTGLHRHVASYLFGAVSVTGQGDAGARGSGRLVAWASDAVQLVPSHAGLSAPCAGFSAQCADLRDRRRRSGRRHDRGFDSSMSLGAEAQAR
jgi:hypothetical protein